MRTIMVRNVRVRSIAKLRAFDVAWTSAGAAVSETDVMAAPGKVAGGMLTPGTRFSKGKLRQGAPAIGLLDGVDYQPLQTGGAGVSAVLAGIALDSPASRARSRCVCGRRQVASRRMLR